MKWRASVTKMPKFNNILQIQGIQEKDMALYALGDLHLAFRSDKSMDQFGEVWVNHEDKILRNCREIVKDDDTLVLVGDHSWGNNLEQCGADLDFIAALPGQKILVRGNHDKFWQVNKTERLNKLYDGRLCFLQNNFYSYRDIALVGTKGYTWEGLDTMEHAEKLVRRELERLRVSFDAAQEAGFDRFIMFLHYPPTNIYETFSGFTQIAEEYRAEQVVYAHCHGKERWHDSLQGMFHGIQYSLVSGDYLNFRPKKLSY